MSTLGLLMFLKLSLLSIAYAIFIKIVVLILFLTSNFITFACIHYKNYNIKNSQNVLSILNVKREIIILILLP